MEGKLVAKYILYFFSYILVYIVAFPILFILVMATDDPTVSHDWVNVTGYIFSVVVTILGAWISNVIFNGSFNLKKNTKYSWFIFISHLVLIPWTWRLFL
ncbi:hypothetical protein [Bacillus cereus]|uniref:hypothetical protein n=1 Tax=Bacillus cereus TaxID=1396 RepID=UPI000BFA45E9|nr:hypothetical protein [Bacillus cereus]PEX83251.1 hypothetical protein CN450_20685 [Bacillus cereus]